MTKQVYIVRTGTRGPGPGRVVGVYSTKRKAIGAIKRIKAPQRFAKIEDAGNVYYAGDFWASWVLEMLDSRDIVLTSID